MSVKFSNSGHQLASASADTTARVWDPYTGRCIHVLSGHKEVAPCSRSRTAWCTRPLGVPLLREKGCAGPRAAVRATPVLSRTVAADLAAVQPPLILPDRE